MSDGSDGMVTIDLTADQANDYDDIESNSDVQFLDIPELCHHWDFPNDPSASEEEVNSTSGGVVQHGGSDADIDSDGSSDDDSETQDETDPEGSGSVDEMNVAGATSIGPHNDEAESLDDDSSSVGTRLLRATRFICANNQSRLILLMSMTKIL